MRIHIEDLTFECIIGILDFERDASQKVTANLWAEYDYSTENFVNYATISEIIQTQMQTNKYELLETAISEITETITTKYPLITKLYIQINKPDILPNATVGVSSLWTQ